jgi:protein SCO1
MCWLRRLGVMAPLPHPRTRSPRARTLLSGLGLVLSVACAGEPSLKGIAVSPPRAVPGFVFTLPGGSAYDTTADGQRATVIFFGYTNCPDVCPTTLADWKRAKQRLGADSTRVRFVFVTVDPARDTPAVAERYAKQFDASFVGLSGDSSTTTNIMRAFGVSSARESTSDSSRYLVSHSAQTFLVDAGGRLIAMYSFGMGWDVLASDLESIL